MKKIIIVSLVFILLFCGLCGCVTKESDSVTAEAVSSTEPVSVVTTDEPDIAVDETEFKNKYFTQIKGQYVKNNDAEHDLMIDELYAKIDEFYDAVKSGITQREYDKFEDSIDVIIGRIEFSSVSQNAMTKESLISLTENMLIDEIKTKLLQIEYSNNKDKSEAERKAPFEKLLDEAEKLTEDVKNGTVTVEEGEKIYRNLVMKYYSLHSVD